MSHRGPYDLPGRVHLIKSPSVSVPPPVGFPTDLHPLPPDLQAYFVYPFSLETFVLDPNNPSSRTIDELHERHQRYLQWRGEEKDRLEKERLRRVAPGWNAAAQPLEPKRKSVLEQVGSPQGDLSGMDSFEASLAGTAVAARSPTLSQGENHPKSQQLDAMQELVEHLNRLDAAAAAAGANTALPSDNGDS